MADITIIDIDSIGTPIRDLNPGDFFCFTSHRDACEVVEHIFHSDTKQLEVVIYRNLNTGSTYRINAASLDISVDRLALVSAKFKLKRDN